MVISRPQCRRGRQFRARGALTTALCAWITLKCRELGPHPLDRAHELAQIQGRTRPGPFHPHLLNPAMQELTQPQHSFEPAERRLGYLRATVQNRSPLCGCDSAVATRAATRS